MLVLSASALLAACATGGVQAPPSLTPTSQYVLRVEPGLDRTAFAVHDQGLSVNQRNALMALTERFLSSGASALNIEAPSDADPAAIRAAWAVRDAVISFGAPPDQTQVVSYQAPSPRAPVL
ncbi:hypothetical protein LTR94_025010, partial [Friedmanniomyces endolithicus]